MFEGMKRALKPGGLMLIEGYGEKQLEYGTGGPKDMDRGSITGSGWKRCLRGFTSLEISEYDEMRRGRRWPYRKGGAGGSGRAVK